MSEVTENELLTRHRKERKDLQTQIQSLKKSCTKSDKKKKKEVMETIVRIEQELDAKQSKELNLNNSNVKDEVEVNDEVRITKAQKRRNKKEAENREREERIKEQEELDKDGPRTIESNKIDQILNEMGLKLHSVPPDGNCLYLSVKHQLEITNRSTYTVNKLRKLTADYLRANPNDFLPFMHSEQIDGVISEMEFHDYCRKVETTTEWGGQIEILALVNILKCPIEIIQADSKPTKQGEEFGSPPLIITYHRHLYGLGEHYNSTSPL